MNLEEHGGEREGGGDIELMISRGHNELPPSHSTTTKRNDDNGAVLYKL